MTVWIDKETRLRVNINAPYKGRSRLDSEEIRAELGVIEVPEPPAPEDYSEDTYYRTECDAAPYVVYTRKSPEQIYQALDAKCTAARAAEYANSTDSLFFKEMRGELPSGTWLAAVQAVKEKYPRPEKPDEQSSIT